MSTSERAYPCEPPVTGESVQKATCATVGRMLTKPSPLPQTAAPAYVPWGMLAAIDVHDGDRERLADPTPSAASSRR